METPISPAEQKINEYTDRIENGESKDSVFKGLPESFRSGVSEKLAQKAKERDDADQKKIDELRQKLEMTETPRIPPIKYTDIVIDDDYMRKNLRPDGGLIMMGGQANWDGEVNIMIYTISDNISPEYKAIAIDKIEKNEKPENKEKTYQHEAHHIKNRENDLVPHKAAENLREFLAFRVLDEVSAFMTGELYNQEMTAENILQSLQISRQRVIASYYGQVFSTESNWYLSKHNSEPRVLSREIDQTKYHKIMRQYFNIKGCNIFTILQEAGKMSEFTEVINELILKLDDILNTIK